MKEVIEQVRREGKKALEKFGDLQVKYKQDDFGPGSVVTEEDIRIERTIKEELKKIYPEYGFYGEEENHLLPETEYFFAIDPIDGTSNYVRNIPLWGVSLGLYKNKKPHVGIIYLPVLDLMFYAKQGEGAYCNDKPIKVSNRELNQSLYYSGIKYKGNYQINKEIVDKVAMAKSTGCGVFELTQVASGNAEVITCDNSLHDVAAALTIITEAGGKITDDKGQPYNINSKKLIITNNKIHEEILKIISTQ